MINGFTLLFLPACQPAPDKITQNADKKSTKRRRGCTVTAALQGEAQALGTEEPRAGPEESRCKNPALAFNIIQLSVISLL
jgi:hypothetical protein